MPGGTDLARRVFEPLGWQVTATAAPLDPAMPGWGESRYLDVRLAGTVRLADALNHLYVLLPVLDDAKHYWVSTGRGRQAGPRGRRLAGRRTRRRS